jgi:hypothetical protein
VAGFWRLHRLRQSGGVASCALLVNWMIFGEQGKRARGGAQGRMRSGPCAARLSYIDSRLFRRHHRQPGVKLRLADRIASCIHRGYDLYAGPGSWRGCTLPGQELWVCQAAEEDWFHLTLRNWIVTPSSGEFHADQIEKRCMPRIVESDSRFGRASLA